MEILFALAIAPAIIGLAYIYIRDKYEKEPWRLLLAGCAAGALLTPLIIAISTWLMRFMPVVGRVGEAVFIAFAVSAFVEEGLKFAALCLLIWYNRNFNEPMDGIVYAVFISLGFAGVENVLYVFNPQLGGLDTAIARALLSVPSHGFFGVSMGYYFALAKFESAIETPIKHFQILGASIPLFKRGINKRHRYIGMAFIAPYLIHAIYNAMLLSGNWLILAGFVPFVVIFWRNGLMKIKKHLEMSPFRA